MTGKRAEIVLCISTADIMLRVSFICRTSAWLHQWHPLIAPLYEG